MDYMTATTGETGKLVPATFDDLEVDEIIYILGHPALIRSTADYPLIFFQFEGDNVLRHRSFTAGKELFQVFVPNVPPEALSSNNSSPVSAPATPPVSDSPLQPAMKDLTSTPKVLGISSAVVTEGRKGPRPPRSLYSRSPNSPPEAKSPETKPVENPNSPSSPSEANSLASAEDSATSSNSAKPAEVTTAVNTVSSSNPEENKIAKKVAVNLNPMQNLIGAFQKRAGKYTISALGNEKVECGASLPQSVYIEDCEGTTIIIASKVAAITLHRCKNVKLDFTSTISSVDLIKCIGCHLISRDASAFFSFDNCSDCKLFFSALLDVKLVFLQSFRLRLTARAIEYTKNVVKEIVELPADMDPSSETPSQFKIDWSVASHSFSELIRLEREGIGYLTNL